MSLYLIKLHVVSIWTIELYQPLLAIVSNFIYENILALTDRQTDRQTDSSPV